MRMLVVTHNLETGIIYGESYIIIQDRHWQPLRENNTNTRFSSSLSTIELEPLSIFLFSNISLYLCLGVLDRTYKLHFRALFTTEK